MIRGLATALCAAALLAPSSAAHGGGGARGFRSTVTAVVPGTPGLAVEVRDSDDRLSLQNGTERPVVILGYEGEPYLRFDPAGTVYRNESSPATYLNEDRFGQVALPTGVSAKAKPRWKDVGDNGTYEWHDHRIHWMSRTDPPRVRRNPDRPQRVFTWVVPGRIDGEKLAIRGRLDYAPPPTSGPQPWHFASVALAAVADAGLIFWRRRRG